MRFAAHTLRHKDLGFPWNAPAFGEEVGIWRSHEKKQAKSSHNKGALGRLISIDLWGNGMCVLIAKGTDIQDPELVNGLQPKTVAVDCLRLSKPCLVPEGWSQDVLTMLAQSVASHTNTPRKDVWLRMDTGHTQYSSSFITEVKSATANDEDDAKQACWGDVAEPDNDVIRPEVVPQEHNTNVGSKLLQRSSKHFSRLLGKNLLQNSSMLLCN